MGIYSTAYQGHFLTIFYSGGANPFIQWDKHIQGGYIKRFLDPELKTLVTDICGSNVITNFMSCPKGNNTLGIHLPFLVMIVKNLNKYFTFEITILDDSGLNRRFRVSNFQSCTQVTFYSTVMPIGLADGWNQIQFNLCDFTRRAYNRQFMEVVSLRINANIRLKRIYFAARLVAEEELPIEYRLFYPLHQKCQSRKPMEPVTIVGTENIPPQYSREIIEQLPVTSPVIETHNLDNDSYARPAEKERPGRASIVSIGSGSKKESRKSVETRRSQESARRSQDLVRKSQESNVKSQKSATRSQDSARNALENTKVGSKESQDTSSKNKKKESVGANLQEVFSSDISLDPLSSQAIITRKKASIKSSTFSTSNIERTTTISNVLKEHASAKSNVQVEEEAQKTVSEAKPTDNNVPKEGAIVGETLDNKESAS